MGSVPNQPATKHMSFRIEEQLKQDVTMLARLNDDTPTDIVRRAFEDYRDEHSHMLPKD